MKNISILSILFLTTAILFACSTPTMAPATSAPAPTMASMTSTSAAAPATETAPPTTAVSPTQNVDATAVLTSPAASESVSKIIEAALAKNQTIKSYRGEMFIDLLGDGKHWKGEVRVPDMHYTISDALGGEVELIVVDEKVYLKGANATGAEEWSLVPEEQQWLYTLGSARGTFRDTVGDLSYYQQIDTAPLDGMQCDIYSQDKRAVAATWFGWLGNQTPPSDQAASFFDKAELQLWICPDGYAHKIEAHFLNKPLDREGIRRHGTVSAHIYDLDTDIVVAAPTSLGQFHEPTPFPTATPRPPCLEATSPPPSVNEGRVILAGFDNANSANFPTGDYGDSPILGKGNREISNGKYRWHLADGEDEKAHLALSEMDAIGDFAAGVTVRSLDSPEGAEAGLVFRRNEQTNSEYIFAITNSGRYVFTIIDDGGIDTLIAPTPSDAIRLNQPNRLQVLAAGPNFKLYINDRLVDEIRDETLCSGLIGVMTSVHDGGTEAEFEFSDFEVRMP